MECTQPHSAESQESVITTNMASIKWETQSFRCESGLYSLSHLFFKLNHPLVQKRNPGCEIACTCPATPIPNKTNMISQFA